MFLWYLMIMVLCSSLGYVLHEVAEHDQVQSLTASSVGENIQHDCSYNQAGCCMLGWAFMQCIYVGCFE